MSWLTGPFLLALPFIADYFGRLNVQAIVASHCAESPHEIPLQSEFADPDGIALLAAPLPRNFRFKATSEHQSGQEWFEDELKIAFDQVWTVPLDGIYQSKGAELQTLGDPLSCDSYEDMESCIMSYANSANVYRFTKTRVRFRDFPIDSYTNYYATQVRFWQMVESEAQVLATWSSIKAWKNNYWAVFTFWSDSELHECSTNDQTYLEWVKSNLIGELHSASM